MLGTVLGLVSEKDRVREEFEAFRPDAVALPLAESHMLGLKEVLAGNVKEMAMITRDEIFASHLRRFGEVQIPPPSLLEGYRLAHERKISCIPVDIGDGDFENLYLTHISGIQNFRDMARMRWLKKHRFRAVNARDFALEWDFHICRLKGFRKIEEARERHMATALISLTDEYSRIFAVVPVERESGIMDEIMKAAANTG